MIRKFTGFTAVAAAITLTTFAGAEGSDAIAQVAAQATDIPAAEAQLTEEVVPVFVENEVVQELPENEEAETPGSDVPAAEASSLRELVDAMPAAGQLSDELQCLAGAVYFESRGEPLAGQLAVARHTVDLLDRSVRITNARFEHGLNQKLDVIRVTQLREQIVAREALGRGGDRREQRGFMLQPPGIGRPFRARLDPRDRAEAAELRIVADRQRDLAAARKAWDQAKALIADPAYDMVLLDELNICLRYDYLPLDEVVEALRNKPAEKHDIVTGRNAKDELIEAADLVTEMTMVKHPFRSGVKAQAGIEF